MMQKVRDPTVAAEKGERKARERRCAWEEGDLCPELMNILMVVCSGIRNLKV